MMGERMVHQICMPWHWGTHSGNEQGVAGDSANDLIAMSGDPNVSIQESKAFRCDVRAGRRQGETTERLAGAGEERLVTARPSARSPSGARPSGWASSPTPRCASAARRARWRASSGTTCPPTASSSARTPRMTTPARWARPPGATCASWRTWRRRRARGPRPRSAWPRAAAATCRTSPRRGADGEGLPDLVDWAEENAGRSTWPRPWPTWSSWTFMSDVCKHCTNAGCLDACPTGAIIKTEFETVVIQADVCNGCGYCIPSCPFGVPDRDPYDGRAAKCTLCYDRLEDGLEPACAKSCPTDSIQFGPYDELVETAKGRVLALHERGQRDAYLYGAGDEPGEELAGGLGAFFLLTQPPERFGLPAQAESPAQENGPVGHAGGAGAPRRWPWRGRWAAWCWPTGAARAGRGGAGEPRRGPPARAGDPAPLRARRRRPAHAARRWASAASRRRGGAPWTARRWRWPAGRGATPAGRSSSGRLRVRRARRAPGRGGAGRRGGCARARSVPPGSRAR